VRVIAGNICFSGYTALGMKIEKKHSPITLAIALYHFVKEKRALASSI
jgi:hypothetical protein